MIYTVHPQIQIRTIRDNGTAEITDKETDGQNFYEEMPVLRARRFVKCWNSHDDLLAACKDALNLIRMSTFSTRPEVVQCLTKGIIKAEKV